MAIPINDTTTVKYYVATAGQTVFPYTWWIREADHLTVFLNDVEQTLTTDYTVSAVQDTGGANVVFNSSLSDGDEVAIVYEPDVERLTEFTTSGKFEAADFNLEFTYLVSLAQFLKTKVNRAVTLTDSDSGSTPTVSGSLTADTILAVDGGGTEVVSTTLTASDLQVLANINADISTVAGISSDVTAVAGNASNINTVAGNITNVNAVASINTDVSTVAGIAADVTSVAGNETNINTVATNIVNVNSFAEIYRIAAANPTTSLDEGDLVYNTTDNVLRYYNGTQWNDIVAFSGNASDVSYSNVTSGLTATNVQAAIDEIDSTIDGLGTIATQDTINNDDWSGNDLDITNGGTGASSAAAARTNLDVDSSSEVDTKVSNATDGLVLGAAVRFVGSTGAVLGSTGVSSVVRNSTGNYTVTLSDTYTSTSTMYPMVSFTNTNGGQCSVEVLTTTTILVKVFATNGSTAVDRDFVHLTLFGDK